MTIVSKIIVIWKLQFDLFEACKFIYTCTCIAWFQFHAMLYLLKFYFTLMCNVYLLNLIMAHENLQTNVILQFHAMDTLHKASYDTSKGSNSLVPSNFDSPIIDELPFFSLLQLQ
jgi:hypothetical protein